MQFILRIVRSKGFDAVMASILGAIVGVIVAGILYGLYRVIVVGALALVTPEIVGTVVLPAIGGLIILGHAVVGFGSGLGMFRGSSLGKFLFYGSANSLARGLTGQLVATLLGIGLFSLFRLARGEEATLLTEPSLVFGAIIGVIGFVMGAGVLTDWMLWIGGHKTPLHHGAPPGKPEWFRYFSVDVNHKVIGIQYGVTSIIVLLVGGLIRDHVPY